MNKKRHNPAVIIQRFIVHYYLNSNNIFKYSLIHILLAQNDDSRFAILNVVVLTILNFV